MELSDESRVLNGDLVLFVEVKCDVNFVSMEVGVWMDTIVLRRGKLHSCSVI